MSPYREARIAGLSLAAVYAICLVLTAIQHDLSAAGGALQNFVLRPARATKVIYSLGTGGSRNRSLHFGAEAVPRTLESRQMT